MSAQPTLADVLERPELVATLALEALAALYGPVARLEADLRAALLSSRPHAPAGPEAAVSDRLLTIPAVAGVLGVPEDYTYGLARRHQIPAVRFGKYVRVRESALNAWVRDHEPELLDRAGSVPHGRPHGLGSAVKPKGIGPRAGTVRRASRREPPARPNRAGRGRTPNMGPPTTSGDGTIGAG